MANEFVIKINKDKDGRKLSLQHMSVETLGALNVFLESFKAFAESRRSEDVKFTLRPGSIEAVIEYPDTEVQVDKVISEVLEGKSRNNQVIKIFKTIQNKIKQNGLDYTISHKGQNVTSVFKAKNFAVRRRKRPTVKYEMIFTSGELYNAGGKKNANIHLQIGKEEITVECSKEQAGKYPVYTNIFIAAVKSWRSDTPDKVYYKLADIYASETQQQIYRKLYIDIKDDKSLNRYDILFDSIMDIITSDSMPLTRVLKIMRLYNFQFVDNGLIRTILVALKPHLGKESKIDDMYKSMAEILRKKSKHQII